MWTCPLCNQSFLKVNQRHACNEKSIEDFMAGKSAHTVELFHYFAFRIKQLAPAKLHTTKTMISAELYGKRILYITQFGKDFIHVVFLFKQHYPDNLCFIKSGQVPGSNQFNHHFRMYLKEDLNDEVESFIKIAVAEKN